MKKLTLLSAAFLIACGASAMAANPFSDVSPDDWAYQAVSDLSSQGVVEGYPDGTFKGEPCFIPLASRQMRPMIF